MLARRFTGIALALTLALMAGCAKAPEQEEMAAQQAIGAAELAEAEDYAPEAMQMARDTLAAAMAAKTEQDGKLGLMRSYDESRRLMEAASRLAEQATTAAAAGKIQVQNETVALQVQVQAALDSAAQALARAPKVKDSKAELALYTNELTTLQATYDAAVQQMSAGSYLEARASFQSVMDRATAIRSELQAAAAKTRR